MKDKKPKKPRDLSYSQGYKIIQKHGYETVKNLWIESGMYETGRILFVSPFVVRHLAQKNGWKRPAEMVPHLVRAVELGRADASSYRNLDWASEYMKENSKKKKEQLSNAAKGKISEEESRFWIQQFREYKDPWGYIAEVKSWLERDKQWKKIETLEELREKITKDDGFEPRHIKKVGHSIEHLKDEGVKFEPK